MDAVRGGGAEIAERSGEALRRVGGTATKLALAGVAMAALPTVLASLAERQRGQRGERTDSSPAFTDGANIQLGAMAMHPLDRAQTSWMSQVPSLQDSGFAPPSFEQVQR